MKNCPCNICKFNDKSGCPKANAEEEVSRLQKEKYRLEDEIGRMEFPDEKYDCRY